ncbi:MAG: sigma-70 family RNA polymerase sigma factor [Flavobacteriales bacterium]|nr:sigma-70 family RNA polymerase sigma factor [Flavobacteriales bacterium]
MTTATRTSAQEALFSQWVREHTGDLQRFARNRVKDPATADDLVQIAFVSAWKTMERFEGNSSPRTWLFAILKHKLADHYRKAYREGIKVSGMEAVGDDPSGTLFVPSGHWHTDHRPQLVQDVFQEEDLNEKLDRALRKCMDALPERMRSVIEMKYLLSKDSAAIREALELSETNMWQQVHRAKLKLRACIEERLTKPQP